MTRDYSDLSPEYVENFWKKVIKHGPDECWGWRGTKRGAYPIFHTGRRKDGDRKEYSSRILALRLSGYEPGANTVTASCGNVSCVNPEHLIYKGKTLEYPLDLGYNEPRRNQFSLSREGDNFLGALAPLRFDKSVTLTMEDPISKSIKGSQGPSKRLIVLVPGPLIGASRDFLLVSVVGKGSCLVRPKSPKVANLVLAGMPAKLAQELMNKIHRTFQE